MTAPIYFHGEPLPHTANVYRLVGKDEDALTYALGHLMAIDDGFMLQILKEVGVLAKIPGKQYKEYSDDYRVYLQEQRQSGSSGRRDIVIEAGGSNGLRVVVEAKIGQGQADACQLLRYTVGCNCGSHPPETAEKAQQIWRSRKAKFIVSLTRDPVDPSVSSQVSNHLNGSGIELRTAQWHQVLETALDRRRQLPIETPQSLFVGEFVNFFKEHYEMKYYDAEVLISDVDATNARIYWDGHTYVGGMRRSAPLYFAPYFTRDNDQDGLSYISRVRHVEIVDPHDRRGAFKLVDHYFSLSPELKARWLANWKTGLGLIFDRSEDEEARGKRSWGRSVRVYFLDEPVRIRQAPLKKARSFPQIPFNYGGDMTIVDLMTAESLGPESPP